LRRLFRTPDSSLTIPGIIKRYGIVSLQDDDVLHDGPPVVLAVPCSPLVCSFIPGLVHSMESLTFFFVARYHCLLLKMKIITMKLSMYLLSFALLAMTGVTAVGPVRAYHTPLFVYVCSATFRYYVND
jgi:hypothetical protein